MKKFTNRPFHNLKTPRAIAPFHHYTEANITKAGEGAFKIRVPFYNNPYQEQPWRSYWIRGFKRAEKAFEDALRLSKRIQETLPLEEVID